MSEQDTKEERNNHHRRMTPRPRPSVRSAQCAVVLFFSFLFFSCSHHITNNTFFFTWFSDGLRFMMNTASNKKGCCCLLLSDVRLTMVSYCRAVLTYVLAYVVSMPCGGDWYFLWSFLPCSVSLSSSLWKRKKKHINKKNKRTRIRIIGEYIAAHQQKERRERRKRQRDVVIDSRLFFGVVLLFLFIRRSTI